jgi:hypothetical protein
MTRPADHAMHENASLVGCPHASRSECGFQAVTKKVRDDPHGQCHHEQPTGIATPVTQRGRLP